jgi:SAM-dependent methyltransferase
LALLAYPFWVEPRIGVTAQSSLWTVGYGLLIGMLAISSGFVWRQAGRRAASETEEKEFAEPAPSTGTRVMWVVPAFVASGLMLAVTNHITSNLASAPFLWILPLAIYLLTFIVAFSETLRFGSARVSRLIPVILLALFPLVSADVIAPPGLNWILIAFHLILLYAGALLCHARLAESRPPSRYLTEFYFWVALGGVLGGVFTATLAPMIFRTILEYPILVAAVAFLRRPEEKGYKFKNLDWIAPVAVGVIVAIVWLVFRKTRIDADVSIPAFVHTALLFVAYRWRKRPIRFALTLTVLMIAYSIILPNYIEGATRLYVTRDFFGVKKIVQNGNLRSLLHGDTTHGVEDTSRPGTPTSYYHPTGSVADILERMGKPLPRVAVLGLGTGTMAAYGSADRHVTFFEIDPQVDDIARAYFTFVPKCGSDCDVIIGDGRLELQRLPEHSFDLVMLDAFSSDAIPTHLASKEALQMYLTKIVPDGILLFHVSNRYLNVEKLVAQLVLDAGLVAFQRVDSAGEFAKEGKTATNHIVVARRVEDLGRLPELPGWKRLTQAPGIRVWTDDYSSLLDLIRWH